MDLFVSMRTFVEVARSGSMNAAARRLNVSSALVGQRVAALESHLEARLLNRTTRRHSLTAFGESYLERCRDILALVAQSEGAADDQRRRPQGRLRVAAPVSFGVGALTPALKDFRLAAPDVDVDLILSDANEDLIAGGFDAAFRIGRLEDSAFLRIGLSPYRMLVCGAPAYLDDVSAPTDPSDLDRCEAVLFSRTGHRPWRFSKGAETRLWAPKARFMVNSGPALRVAACAGMGLAMLPERLVRDDVAAGALMRVLPDWTLPEQPMSLIYHRDRYRPQRLELFVAFVRSTFGSG